MRSLLASGDATPALFRAALTAVAPMHRDAWLDRVLALDERPEDRLPEDGPALPRGCAPYLPCPVDSLLAAVDLADVTPPDVFIDVGAGIGRAVVAAHLLTGASAIGLEIQPQHAAAGARHAKAIGLSRVSMVVGDAAEHTRTLATGSVFFLYCPFSGERLARLMRDLEAIAKTRQIRVCCVDLPLSPGDWLTAIPSPLASLTVYRSRPPSFEKP